MEVTPTDFSHNQLKGRQAGKSEPRIDENKQPWGPSALRSHQQILEDPMRLAGDTLLQPCSWSSTFKKVGLVSHGEVQGTTELGTVHTEMSINCPLTSADLTPLAHCSSTRRMPWQNSDRKSLHCPQPGAHVVKHSASGGA
eukprot:scaffold157534_cov15-Tisochrysis_lutea.AAC.1